MSMCQQSDLDRDLEDEEEIAAELNGGRKAPLNHASSRSPSPTSTDSEDAPIGCAAGRRANAVVSDEEAFDEEAVEAAARRRRDDDRRSAERSRDASPDPEQAAREAREAECRRKIDRVLSAANSFEVLELPVQETGKEDVVKAYRLLSVKVHLDKAPADYRAKAKEVFKKLGVAKDELEDPAKQAALRKKIEAERAAEEAEEAEAARQAAQSDLSPWQEYIEKRIQQPIADDRELLYVKGPGSCGKTWMTRYVVDKYGDRVLVLDYSSARHALLAVCEEQERLNAMGKSAIIILDIPRSAKIDHEFYIVAETIKGANFQAPLKPVKGKTMQCKLDFPPCVLVFSNRTLAKSDLENLTADRWDIMSIHPDTQEAVSLKQAHRWIDEITEERYKEALQEIVDDQAEPADVNEEIVHECFEVDAGATAELIVSKDLLPVMWAAGYDKNNLCLGILLGRVFKKELQDGTVKVKKGGKKGSRYIGLKIKADAAV